MKNNHAGYVHSVKYHLLPQFIQHRKAWLKEAQANGQETLARVLKGNIEYAEKMKELKKEIKKQLELF